MNRLEKFFLVLFTVAAVQAIAVAEANATEAQSLMDELDVNEDDYISLKEAVRHIELLRNFGLIDENEDGKLTEAELSSSKRTPNNKIAQANNH
jgi:Ca2+-binding EF-hand superfamily protein